MRDELRRAAAWRCTAECVLWAAFEVELRAPFIHVLVLPDELEVPKLVATPPATQPNGKTPPPPTAAATENELASVS